MFSAALCPKIKIELVILKNTEVPAMRKQKKKQWKLSKSTV